jgi:hypothetical protein
LSEPTYQVGDVADGHVLGGDGRWHPLLPEYPMAPDRGTTGTKVAIGLLVAFVALSIAGTVVIGVLLAVLASTATESASPSAPTPAVEGEADSGTDTVVRREDFDTGAGPFFTGADASSSASVVDGALRLENSDPEWAAESYAELGTPVSSIAVTTEVTLTEPLRAEEGPALSIARGEELLYQFWIDGEEATLWEWQGLEDYRLLDSAALLEPVNGQVVLGLEVVAAGSGARLIGTIDGEPVVEERQVSGAYDAVVLDVWSDGRPRTVDFEWVEIRSAGAAWDRAEPAFTDALLQQAATGRIPWPSTTRV